jgi:hypothetical protein
VDCLLSAIHWICRDDEKWQVSAGIIQSFIKQLRRSHHVSLELKRFSTNNHMRCLFIGRASLNMDKVLGHTDCVYETRSSTFGDRNNPKNKDKIQQSAALETSAREDHPFQHRYPCVEEQKGQTGRTPANESCCMLHPC